MKKYFIWEIIILVLELHVPQLPALLHVEVAWAEDEALKVGEVVVLHQPGDGPDLGQGEGHELGVR